MGDHDGGDPQLLLQLAQLDLHVFAKLRIQRGQRFVEKEQRGIDGQRPGDGDPLALASGQLVDSTVPDPGKPDEIEQLAGAGVARRAPHAANPQRIDHVFHHGEVGEQRERLEHHAEPAPVGRNARLVDAVHQDPAAGGKLQPRDQAQERGLSATRGAEQADEGAVRDVDIDVVDRGDRAERLREPPETERGHRRRLARRGPEAPRTSGRAHSPMLSS